MKKLFFTLFALLTCFTTTSPTQLCVTNKTGEKLYYSIGRRPSDVIKISDGKTTWKIGTIENFKKYQTAHYELYKDEDLLVAKMTTSKKQARKKTPESDTYVKVLSYLSLKFEQSQNT